MEEAAIVIQRSFRRWIERKHVERSEFSDAKVIVEEDEKSSTVDSKSASWERRLDSVARFEALRPKTKSKMESSANQRTVDAILKLLKDAELQVISSTLFEICERRFF